MANRCSYLDMYDGVLTELIERPENMPKIYVDTNHVSEDVSRSLVDPLIGHMDRVSGLERPARLGALTIPAFDIVEVAGSGPNVREYESSIARGRFHYLEGDATLKVAVGRCERIHGVVVNSVNSFGNLVVEGSETLIKRIGKRHDTGARTFVAQVISFMAPIRDAAGEVTLRVARPEEDVTENSLQAMVGSDRVLEISQIIVERSPTVYIKEIPEIALSELAIPWKI